MRYLASLFVLGLLALPAEAQWFVRGQFNNWTNDADPMVDLGGGHYSYHVTGLTPGQITEYKVTVGDWSENYPGSNGKTLADANGEITFHFYDDNEWDDGWGPATTKRVGYNDPLQFGWEIAGTMNDWSGGEDWHLESVGSGLYRGTFDLAQQGYNFKFRQQGSWDYSIGGDFGNSAGDIFFLPTQAGEWIFELDLPGGRWRTYSESTPGVIGDYDGDSFVDAKDYVIWAKSPGSFGGTEGYDAWKMNYGNSNTPPPPGWFARGTFNGFGLDHELIFDENKGAYTVTVTGLDPGVDFDYKIANSTFSESYPGANGRVRSNAAGEITFNFYELEDAAWNDGWFPNNVSRVGYEDHQQFGWEIVGSFNGWPGEGAPDPDFFLQLDPVTGVYYGEFQFFADTYQFKFRQQGSWNTSIGADFGNSFGDNEFTVLNHGDTWRFELDLAGGRWRAIDLAAQSAAASAAVPEPASVAMAMLGALALAGLTRRKQRV